MPGPRIAVLGLGEAGSAIAQDLVHAGASIHGYDPRSSGLVLPVGITNCSSEAEAVRGAELVLSVNSAQDAPTALRNALPALPEHSIWADLNTSSGRLKRELAALLAKAGRFADVALMSPVPGRGVRTPMLVSGAGAGGYAELMGPLGAQIAVLDDPPGAAADRKLLRSVFFKGLAASVIESLTAARAVGLEDWLRESITDELTRADAGTLDRLERGSIRHAVRRSHEMAAATDLLGEIGVPARIAAASRDLLVELAEAARPDPLPESP
jgi:3-hydroxyisobutyrate dehydrogenase-like beta-hydroxyacid dehydrogenase